MKFDPTRTDALLELLRWRRDVRHFTDKPVSDQDMATLEHAMSLAPSVGNSRPWRVIKVQSAHLRQKIIANHKTANEAAAELYDDAKRKEYSALKLAALEDAPVQLAVFTESDPVAGHGLGRQSMSETLSYSTVIAIHGLWLAARSLNLGVGWVSILNPEEVERALKVDPSWTLTAYLCIGHAKFDDDTPELERVGWQEVSRRPWGVRE